MLFEDGTEDFKKKDELILKRLKEPFFILTFALHSGRE
jgi:hypothetical protein